MSIVNMLEKSSFVNEYFRATFASECRMSLLMLFQASSLFICFAALYSDIRAAVEQDNNEE
jgi:hypothetical protein